MIKVKTISKLIISILLLLIIAFCFSACAQVRAMTITNNDGSIDEMVTISIIPEEVLNLGYNIVELKNGISRNSISEAQAMAEKLDDKITQDLFLTNDQETIQTLNSYKGGISIVKTDWKDNTFIIGIRFKNIDIYKYYYGIKGDTKTVTYTEKHFFYNKLYYYASTMYVKHYDLYNLISGYYSTHYPGLVASENTELLYTFKTDLRRQHSNADYITKQNGEYYHTWIVDKDNVDDPIMLYYNIANPENYILVGLAITGVVAVTLFSVCFVLRMIKFKKDKQKEDEV